MNHEGDLEKEDGKITLFSCEHRSLKKKTRSQSDHKLKKKGA